MREFLIADTHFGHGNIIKYEQRPFESIKHMDDSLINNWNNTVRKDDKVFMLGDFALAKKERIVELIGLLNGYKILILGNHDRNITCGWWLRAGFNLVIPNPMIVHEWFILSHEPIYINENMPYANIFGHVHGSAEYKDYSNQSFCVSIERIGYKPILFNDVIKTMKGE